MNTEIVRDSCLLYEQMAYEQLIMGQAAELLRQRNKIGFRKICPACKTEHYNLDSDYCSLCEPEWW